MSKVYKPRVIPNNWSLIKIKDITKTGSGGTPLSTVKEYYENGTVPWINSGEIGQNRIKKAEKYITEKGKLNSSTTLFPKASVLVALYGATAGKVSLLDINATTNQAVCAIYPSKTFNSQFLKYYLDTLYWYLVGVSTGSARDNLSQKGIQELEIPFPNIQTQNSIAKVLSDLDAKIELNHKINQELESMAKSLYDYWFVQFDFPNEQGKPYKSSGGRMAYNKELRREIPEGWEVKQAKEIAEIKAGGDKPKVYSSVKTEIHKVPIYSNGTTNEGLYGYTNEANIVKQSITVTGRGANIGYTVLRNSPFVPIIRLLVITPHYSYITKYLYESFKRIGFYKSGSAQPQLTVPQISTLKVILPPSELLKKYESLTSGGIHEIEINKEQNQQLTSLRDWLLPMLMNGQVTVGEVEKKSKIAVEPRVEYNN
jgi:type I restriction enzyme S subunit